MVDFWWAAPPAAARTLKSTPPASSCPIMRAEGAADACSSGSESDEMEAGPAWGAATLPMHVPSPSTACAPAHGNTPLSQLQVPVGIGVAGSSATIPVRVQCSCSNASPHGPLPLACTQASITSTEHLAAYADYCKRALSNAVNGPLLSKRDALLHQVRLLLWPRAAPALRWRWR